MKKLKKTDLRFEKEMIVDLTAEDQVRVKGGVVPTQAVGCIPQFTKDANCQATGVKTVCGCPAEYTVNVTGCHTKVSC